jgi:DNA-binding PucR family transcriptional regulator
MFQDDLLATSLREIYLAPLAGQRGGGEALIRTLRAYFDAQRNVSSAAAVLGVKRHTVTNRLRTVEDLLNRPLATCANEIDAVLRLEEMNGPLPSQRGSVPS